MGCRLPTEASVAQVPKPRPKNVAEVPKLHTPINGNFERTTGFEPATLTLAR